MKNVHSSVKRTIVVYKGKNHPIKESYFLFIAECNMNTVKLDSDVLSLGFMFTRDAFLTVDIGNLIRLMDVLNFLQSSSVSD